MKKHYFFLFFCSVLYGQLDPFSIISAENEPSALVEGKINAITGKWVGSDRDLTIQGVEPIVIHRTFVNGEWSIAPSFKIEETTSHNLGHSYTILENSGARIRYKFTDQKIYIQGERYRKYIPVDLENGYTNTSRGVLSSRTNLHNNVLFVGPKEKQMLLQRSDGSICTYRKLHHGYGRYLLLSEHLPNGNWIFYEYEEIGKDYKEARLRFIQTTNPSQNQIYARADFFYEDRKWKDKDFKIIGSDGQKVEYTYKKDNPHHYRTFLLAVNSSDKPNQGFSYYDFSGLLHYMGKGLKEVSWPLGRKLEVKFYTENKNHVLGQNIYMENSTYKETFGGVVYDKFVADPRCGRVLTLSAPVGSDASLYVTHSFLYDLPNKKTSVYDLENQRIDYHWDDHFRLKEIAYYGSNGKRKKRERFAWSSSGNLLCKSLIDWDLKPVWAKKYSYNIKGDVIEETEFGNLTGKGSSLLLDANNLPIEKGVEKYARRFTYINQNECSLLASMEEDDGKKIEYTYLPGTDLLTVQITFFKGELKEKKLWEYDGNHILIKEIIQTPTTHLIKRITPKPSAPYFGMPWIIEEKYLEDGKEFLLKKTVLHYTTGARIAKKEIYDSDDQLCYTLSYRYDEKGHLIEYLDELGRLERFRYDECGNQILHQHPSGRKTATFKYDLSNRLVASSQNGDDGIILREEYAYDKMSRLIREKKPLGYEASFTYDSFGNLSQKHIHLIGTFIFSHDGLGRLISEKNPDGSIQKTIYSAKHQPIQIEHPDKGIEKFIYYPNGLLKTQIDAENTEVSYEYNYQGNPVSKVQSFNGNVLSQEFFEYNGPYLVAQIDAEKNRTSFAYDFAGRLITTCCEDEKCEFAYDSLGRKVLEKKGPLATVKKYDFANRVIEESKIGEGQVFHLLRYEYDSADQQTLLTRFIDGKESNEKRVYDSLGRIIQYIDPLGSSTKTIYEHTPFLKETTIDPMGLQKIKKYNSLQKVTSIEILNNQGKVLSKQECKLDFRSSCKIPVQSKWTKRWDLYCPFFTRCKGKGSTWEYFILLSR